MNLRQAQIHGESIESMKTALVYDRVNKWGGAERLLLALRKLFPEAPLFTSVYNKDTAPWADVFDIKTSFLQNFPKASKNHELYALFMPLAFEPFNFSEFDLVISVTSEAAKGIITKPSTCHICYCLTPTRYLWSGYDDYFANPFLRTFSRPAVSYLRKWDLVASQRPDYFISISKEVARRVKKYYKRDSEVIYPPLSLQRQIKDLPREDFFLLVGRFVPYKKLKLAVEAFNKSKRKLKIVGSGLEEESLKNQASPSIEFLSGLSDEELSILYQKCRALIFPGIEDFGLVMAEAESFGTPVIAFRGGGALEIIEEGKTGEFFSEQTANSLNQTLSKFDNKSYNSFYIRKSAQKFSFENFKAQFLASVEEKVKEYFD